MKLTKSITALQVTAQCSAPRVAVAPARSVRTVARNACAVLLLVGGGVLSPGCAEKVTSATSSCPCATGNVCCASGVCAASENACPAATLALAQESSGVWTGYIENFNFPSGSDAISISLSVAGDVVSGQVVFGDPATPVDSVDPSSSYGTRPDGPPADPSAGEPDYKEGFAYQARDIRWENRRLKLAVNLSDAWKTRCDAIPPLTVGGQTFICPTSWSYLYMEGCKLVDGTPIDCALLGPCNGISGPGHCSCNVTECHPNGGIVYLDIALRDNIGDGSEQGIGDGGGSYNLRVTRPSM
jgi:hypothetical protein